MTKFSMAVVLEEENHISLKQSNFDDKFTISLHTKGNYADSVIYQDIDRAALERIRNMINGALDHKDEE